MLSHLPLVSPVILWQTVSLKPLEVLTLQGESEVKLATLWGEIKQEGGLLTNVLSFAFWIRDSMLHWLLRKFVFTGLIQILLGLIRVFLLILVPLGSGSATKFCPKMAWNGRSRGTSASPWATTSWWTWSEAVALRTTYLPYQSEHKVSLADGFIKKKHNKLQYL